MLNKLLLITLALNYFVLASWNCKEDIVIEELKFNFSKLNKDYAIKTNATTKPTTTETRYEINVCQGIEYKDKDNDKDQCEKGTFVCQKKINYKEGEQPRVISLIQLASGKKDPSLAVSKLDDKFDSLHWTMVGEKIGEQEQSTFVQFQCDKDKDEEPKFLSYENGELKLSWITKYACIIENGPKQPKTPDNDTAKEGGIAFASVLAFLIIFYFVGGVAYNYHFQNARGIEVIPNLEFWQQFPRNLMDLIHYAISSVSGRRRRGYSHV